MYITMRQRIHEKRKLDFACLTDATFTLVYSTKPKVAFILSISIESRRPPLIFDGSQLRSVQHTVYKAREFENVLRISAWQFRGPSLFSKSVASTRFPIFFLLFSFSVFLFFSFLFFFFFDEHRAPTGRNGDTASPLGFAFFIPCLSAPLPARQRACSPAWQAAPAYGNATR